MIIYSLCRLHARVGVWNTASCQFCATPCNSISAATLTPYHFDSTLDEETQLSGVHLLGSQSSERLYTE